MSHSLAKHKALGSNPSTEKKKKNLKYDRHGKISASWEGGREGGKEEKGTGSQSHMNDHGHMIPKLMPSKLLLVRSYCIVTLLPV
jgi:hypothetical protein